MEMPSLWLLHRFHKTACDLNSIIIQTFLDQTAGYLTQLLNITLEKLKARLLKEHNAKDKGHTKTKWTFRAFIHFHKYLLNIYYVVDTKLGMGYNKDE